MEPSPSSPPQTSERHFRSLIKLLSDPNPRIAKTIHARLVDLGMAAVPLLLQAHQHQPGLADRITQVIGDIQHHSLAERFRQLGQENPEHLDLEEGAFLIATIGYPNLDWNTYQTRLTDMSKDIAQRFTDDMSLRQQILEVNRYLFTELGFKGNDEDYYDPDNSFLNKVIDRRSGIPISLSVVYILISQRLRLPVRGVGMPGHFLVGLETEEVFIDCFNGGTLLTQVECSRILHESGHGFDPRFLDTSSNLQILLRMLRNLVSDLFQPG